VIFLLHSSSSYRNVAVSGHRTRAAHRQEILAPSRPKLVGTLLLNVDEIFLHNPLDYVTEALPPEISYLQLVHVISSRTEPDTDAPKKQCERTIP
jgi:hypothetical protein